MGSTGDMALYISDRTSTFSCGRDPSPGDFRVFPDARRAAFARAGVHRSDSQDSTRVAIVNQSLAERHWPGSDPIGQRLTMDRGETWITIVGVAGDVKEYGPGRPAPDEIYMPSAQRGMLILAVLVRSSSDPEAATAAARRAIREVDRRSRSIAWRR